MGCTNLSKVFLCIGECSRSLAGWPAPPFWDCYKIWAVWELPVLLPLESSGGSKTQFLLSHVLANPATITPSQVPYSGDWGRGVPCPRCAASCLHWGLPFLGSQCGLWWKTASLWQKTPCFREDIQLSLLTWWGGLGLLMLDGWLLPSVWSRGSSLLYWRRLEICESTWMCLDLAHCLG